jgi:soluble lytic murein transglycosylase-like protein
MGSTFFGLVLGIIIAGFITTHYSDALNHLVRDLVSARQPLVAPVEEVAPSATALPQEPGGESITEPLAKPLADPLVESQAVLSAESPPATVAELSTEPGVQTAMPTVVTPVPVAELALPTAETAVAAERIASAPKPTAGEEDFLAQRWSEFAAQADQLQPVGEFRWRECFTRAAAAYGVSEPLLLAVASGESAFDPAARSDKDAVGLMQIRWPDTSRHLGVMREADLYDPCTNVSAGARYLAELTERFGSDLHRAVAAYNYGPSRIDAGELPEGARWYSQYIYQHLQQVLGKPHVPSSELLPPRHSSQGGFEVLSRFNQAYRARDFKIFLESLLPGLQLAQRSEALGQHEVVLLYQDDSERRRGLAAIHDAGLVAASRTNDLSISL